MNFLVKTVYEVVMKALQSLKRCQPLPNDTASHDRRLHTWATPLWEPQILYRAPLFGSRAGRLLTIIIICVHYADETHGNLHRHC